MWKDDKFVIPDDIKADPAKVTEYYDKNYGERYKDYDTLKTRAADADEWGKLGKREDIATQTQTYAKVQEALRQGKVIVTDNQGRIFAKDPAELTTAERRQVQQNRGGGDGGGGEFTEIEDDAFDELTPRQQRAYYKKMVAADLARTVAEKEKQYGETITGVQNNSTQMVNTLLEIQSALQDHPSLKLKDVLAKMAEHAAKGDRNPLKTALDEYTRPAMIQEEAKKIAAQMVAEDKLKAEKVRAEKVLTTSRCFVNVKLTPTSALRMTI